MSAVCYQDLRCSRFSRSMTHFSPASLLPIRSSLTRLHSGSSHWHSSAMFKVCTAGSITTLYRSHSSPHCLGFGGCEEFTGSTAIDPRCASRLRPSRAVSILEWCGCQAWPKPSSRIRPTSTHPLAAGKRCSELGAAQSATIRRSALITQWPRGGWTI